MLLPLIHLPGKRFFSIFFFTARICGDSVGMLSAMGNSDSTSHIFNILEGTEKAPDRKSLIAGIHGTHKYSQDV